METCLKKTVRARRSRIKARGVTLVEVLIVVSIMAVISGAAALFAVPMFNEAKIKTAVTGCATVKQAADLFRELDAAGDQCPTIQDLVSNKRIEASKTEDPWGVPYKINCAEGEIHVTSSGKDRKDGTPDDLRDDFKPADIQRVKKL